MEARLQDEVVRETGVQWGLTVSAVPPNKPLAGGGGGVGVGTGSH